MRQTFGLPFGALRTFTTSRTSVLCGWRSWPTPGRGSSSVACQPHGLTNRSQEVVTNEEGSCQPHGLTPSPPRHTPHKPAQEDKAMEASNSVELTDPSAIIQVRSKLRWGRLNAAKNAPRPHFACLSHTPPTLHAKHRCFRNCKENVNRYVRGSKSLGG